MSVQRDRANLESAFRAAHYRIESSRGSVVRHVGIVDAAADAALAADGCRSHWAIVTPCNPGAQRLSDQENAERLATLVGQLNALQIHHLPAVNTTQDDSWPEPGCCLFDAAPVLVERLASECGQLAYVSARLGEAPALIWIER